MSAYSIEIEGNELKVAFGIPANNDVIVKDAFERLNQMNNSGTFDDIHLVKINGPMSIPVAMVLALSWPFGAGWLPATIRSWIDTLSWRAEIPTGRSVNSFDFARANFPGLRCHSR